MIKRDVFLEDYDDMFDRRCGANVMDVIRIAVLIVGDGACTRDRKGQSGYQTSGCWQTHWDCLVMED